MSNNSERSNRTTLWVCVVATVGIVVVALGSCGINRFRDIECMRTHSPLECECAYQVGGGQSSASCLALMGYRGARQGVEK